MTPHTFFLIKYNQENKCIMYNIYGDVGYNSQNIVILHFLGYHINKFLCYDLTLPEHYESCLPSTMALASVIPYIQYVYIHRTCS